MKQMRNARQFVVVLCLCICLFGIAVHVALASDVVISSRVDKTRVTVGTKITYCVSVEYTAPTIILSEISVDHLNQFTVRKDDGQVVTDLGGGRTRIDRCVTIVPYSVGEFSVLPCVIPYKDSLSSDSVHEVSTDEVVVVVTSVLDSKDDNDIKPIKDIYDPLSRVMKTLRTTLIWIIFAAALMVVYRMVKGRKEGFPFIARPPLTAYEYALKRLFEVKQKDYLTAGSVSVYADELSDIVRAYIGEHFSCDVLELTTGELAGRLPAIVMDEALQKKILRFLVHCDAMKFAKYMPDAAALHDLFDQTRSLLESVHTINVSPEDSGGVV